MRIIIYTGKGGVGKTSVSAATGIKLAKRGIKTLVISTDLAHSLSDSFGLEINHEATEICKNLYAMELNPQSQLEKKWKSIYNYLVSYLKILGVKDVFAEELTLFPGVEELFSLLEIHDQHQEGIFEALILDFPPTASTLRLLSFFDVVSWYMERFFKIKRRGVKFLRHFTDTVMDLPLPEDDVFTAVEEIYQKMLVTKDILVDKETTSVRIVMNPEDMVISESQRAYTYLNLYGFNVDGIIVNKLLPGDLEGEFYSRIIERQYNNLKKIEELFSPLEVFTLPLSNEELKGLNKLESISEQLYTGKDLLDNFQQLKTISLDKEGDTYHFKIYMPFLDKRKFKLHQKGGLLIITVGTYKQKVHLPQVLSNKKVSGAKYRDQFLHLYF